MTSREDEPAASLPLYPGNAAREAWSSFILRESSRRTLLATFQLVAICRLLLGDFSSCLHQHVSGNKFIVSSALWQAKSHLDFARAWNDKKYFLVQELDFENVLREADADDVDGFALMMLTGM